MWIPSKLTAPSALHNAILRPRLLNQLAQAKQHKLVLFHSPAGFGKTTMAAQWLDDKPNMGWFSIDEGDNDAFSFANYFVKALNLATNDCCAKTATMAEKGQFNNLTSLFNQLLGELTSWKAHAYLALDDYHFITEDEIHKALTHFLKHAPENLTLVITSRTQPPLGVAALRVHCKMLEIDNPSLAFDEEETDRFLRQFDARLAEHGKSLREQVEGWPSAMQLIAMNSAHRETVPTFDRANTLPHLWDYLAEEVFDQLDESSRTFLMQCSVLDRFNAELAQMLTGREDALATLLDLHRQGLFIVNIGVEGNWYRFHNLFGNFLSHQRQKLLPGMENTLREKAVQAWLSVNNPTLALTTALDARESRIRVDVLRSHGWHLFNNGHIRLLSRALETLTDDELYTQPRLVLLKAWLVQSQHRYNHVGELIEIGMREMKARAIELAESEQGEFNALMAQVAINQGRPEQALELSEKAFAQLPTDVYRSRIVATSVIGEVYHCLGTLNRALTLMQQSEKLARQHHVYQQALWALLQQCEIYMARGSMQLALDSLDKAEELIEIHHLEQVPLHEFMLRLRAQICWSLHRLDEAEQLAQRSMDVLSYYEAHRSIPAYTMLANVALARGELDKAERHLEQCQHLLGLTECHLDWRAKVYNAQLVLWQLKDQPHLAKQWLEDAEVPEKANNHFQQLQYRNLARAHALCGDIDMAYTILHQALEQSQALQLSADVQRVLSLLAAIQEQDGQTLAAQETLIQAMSLSSHSNILICFYLDRNHLQGVLTRIAKMSDVDVIVRHQARTVLESFNRSSMSRAVHFDEALVEKLLASDNLPAAVRVSHLTIREWQVLGLIYSGYSNDQISAELDVALTTIKTHIRNLYQKLQITNRDQAIAIADKMIKSIQF
ncbi:HTH-type transcriptional regulator MalT [Vibrio sp. SM6]|uniref:HTH-type transcriptional regulator MalT n=1 Tax=Vibrio agarilyticus TaxID=2726741 RepID=A0A7X8TN58_9VIBR|nr:HTH-type transcriptional regulator MalT [Vibrio agarilyticus]NLS11825.1 HTH-type transcriptional regulator MalT [Vibrio agarilyticus]